MNPSGQPRAPGRLLKMSDVVRETSLHRATIYRRIADGSFPPGRPIGGGRVAWPEADVTAWIEATLAET
jgi:prophage regulatory protein